MARWLVDRLLALRTWLLVRLGLWRGQWRSGRVSLPAAPFTVGPLAPRTWRYALYVPQGVDDDAPAPLLVVLHGCRQSASAFAEAAGLTRLADRERVRLLCPQQRRVANPYRCWNWFAPLAQGGAGELRVVLAMLNDIGGRVRVDRHRVAAVGLSAGGGLAALLAFHAADRIRAVVAVAAPPLLGSLNVDDPREVMRRGLLLAPELALGPWPRACAPLAIVQGSADTVVHPDCGGQLAAQALESLRRAGIHVSRQEVPAVGGVRIVDYRDDASLRLRRIDVAGLGHAWSGGPGGHAYCTRGGVGLTGLCAQFLHEVGVLGR